MECHKKFKSKMTEFKDQINVFSFKYRSFNFDKDYIYYWFLKWSKRVESVLHGTRGGIIVFCVRSDYDWLSGCHLSKYVKCFTSNCHSLVWRLGLRSGIRYHTSHFDNAFLCREDWQSNFIICKSYDILLQDFSILMATFWDAAC